MQLRDYQTVAIQAVFDFWKQNQDTNNCNGVLIAPTGAGKSVLIAEIARLLTFKNEHRSILVVAHRKELVSQNAEKFIRLTENKVPCGIWSAGLGIKKSARVTFAGIQSVFKLGASFGYQSLLIVDECHLLSRKSTGMYQTLIKDLKATNPRLRILGLSATPFRLDSGSLIGGDDAIFHDIAHEIGLRELVEAGYLSRLVSKSSKLNINLDNVKIQNGDYQKSELEMCMSELDLVKRSVKETIERAGSRGSWLFFCSGVRHTKLVRDELREAGINAEMVTGETFEMERDRVIGEFKAGRLKALVNCDVLTTGFDAPNTDLICLLRPTKSCGLFMQMCGRGMRLSPETGKSDCLVLDFGGNISRFGPIDTIKIRHNKKGGKSKIERKMVKECPECNEWCALAAKECAGCGYQFPERLIQHSTLPSVQDIMSSVEVWDITGVDFKRHSKVGKPDSFKITYYDGNLRKVSDYLCFEHGGFAARKARNLWHSLTGCSKAEAPETVQEALDRANEILKIDKIKIVFEGKFPRVIERVISTEPEFDSVAEWGVNI